MWTDAITVVTTHDQAQASEDGGNSLGTTCPKELLSRLNVKKG
jgi:hypothetical protein